MVLPFKPSLATKAGEAGQRMIPGHRAVLPWKTAGLVPCKSPGLTRLCAQESAGVSPAQLLSTLPVS